MGGTWCTWFSPLQLGCLGPQGFSPDGSPKIPRTRRWYSRSNPRRPSHLPAMGRAMMDRYNWFLNGIKLLLPGSKSLNIWNSQPTIDVSEISHGICFLSDTKSVVIISYISMFVHCAKIYQCEVGLLQGETLIILVPILVDEHPPWLAVSFSIPVVNFRYSAQ